MRNIGSVCEFPLVVLVQMLILSWIVSTVIDSNIFFVGFSLQSRYAFYLDFSCSFWFPFSRIKIFCENSVAMKELFGVNFQEIDYAVLYW